MSTLIERPAIEYNLSEHCNLSCEGCNHASPLFSESFADLVEFERDLTALSEVLHAQQMRIVGGEPTLHPQLLEFLKVVRRVGIADSTVLYTNGVLLHRLDPEVWELIDELFLSVYPGVRMVLSVAALEVIAREHGVKLRRYEIDTFTLTVLNNPIEDPEVIRQTFRSCAIAGEWSCHPIHGGRFYKCALAPFHQARLEKIGLRVESNHADGVPLHHNPNLREQLERYLADEKPLRACDYCMGTSGPTLPHRMLNKKGKEGWLTEDHRPAIAQFTKRVLAGVKR